MSTPMDANTTIPRNLIEEFDETVVQLSGRLVSSGQANPDLILDILNRIEAIVDEHNQMSDSSETPPQAPVGPLNANRYHTPVRVMKESNITAASETHVISSIRYSDLQMGYLAIKDDIAEQGSSGWVVSAFLNMANELDRHIARGQNPVYAVAFNSDYTYSIQYMISSTT
jgi:hypothetical protein